MFEYGNEPADRKKIALRIALTPFSLFWIFHRSLLSAFLLQVCIISFFSFVFGPDDLKGLWDNMIKLWFLKAIFVTVCVIHPLFLAVLWYLDKSYPFLIIGAGSVFVTAFIVGAIEMVVVGETTNYFRRDAFE
jgi:hypothetical protein